MLTKLVAARVARWLGAGLVSASILAWIADRSGPAKVDVVIHVTAPDVEVSVGGHLFRVEGRRVDPLVCRLAPGRHELITRRGDRVLQRYEFEVGREADVAIVAWDPGAESPGPPADRREAAGSVGRGLGGIGGGLPRQGFDEDHDGEPRRDR